METLLTKKEDFVEIDFTGKVNGKVFDSNIPEDLKKISPDAKPQKMVVIIGQNMLIKGLDEALEGKEIGKKYNIHVGSKDGYGERKRDLVKTIPLKVFAKHKINPYPGAALYLDNMLVRIITISGARVITDFNNPLAGKDLDYEFTIKKIVEEENEKIETFFMFYYKFVPKFEISENKITVSGKDELEAIIKMSAEKFKEIFDKDLEYKKEVKTEEKKEKR